uniref:Uncharacterized protein TCIL3000_8_3570 n=1 Tax=Trypanosoma congolense (strain IL3000) TaxID=1068625 RepID=G0URX6_TRYCI|nr:unnamed protein product [Trypanosoma congolense IL3000]
MTELVSSKCTLSCSSHAKSYEGVRNVKAFDDMTQKRLGVFYGVGDAVDRTAKKLCIGGSVCSCLLRETGWFCQSCGKVSHDARRVCGHCLVIDPSLQRSFTVDVGKNTEASIDVGVPLDSSFRVVTFSHRRCFRVFVPQQLDALGSGVPPRCSGGFIVDEPAQTGKHAEVCAQGPESAVQGRRRRRKPYTHFISIPFGKVETLRSHAASLLEEMKQRCLDPEAGVTEDIFTTPPRIHMTLLMLSLPTDDAVSLALNCMNTLRERLSEWRQVNVTNNGDVSIKLGGLHVMHGGGQSVNSARVLYMGLADEDSAVVVGELQDIIHECFDELIKDDLHVAESKLFHVTLMNTKWRVSEGDLREGRRAPSFDARRILQYFSGATLSDGSVFLNKVELCALHYDAARECYTCLDEVFF